MTEANDVIKNEKLNPGSSGEVVAYLSANLAMSDQSCLYLKRIDIG